MVTWPMTSRDPEGQGLKVMTTIRLGPKISKTNGDAI